MVRGMGEETGIQEALSAIINLTRAEHQRLIADRLIKRASESHDGSEFRALRLFANELLAELADAAPTTILVGFDGVVFAAGSREKCLATFSGVEDMSPDILEERELRMVPAPWPGVRVDDVVKALARGRE